MDNTDKQTGPQGEQPALPDEAVVQETSVSPADAGPDTSGASESAQSSPANTSGSSRVLTLLLLLLVLGSLGLHAWQWYLQRQSEPAAEQLGAQLQRLETTQRSELLAVNRRMAELDDDAPLRALQTLAADLQRNQQALAQRFDSLQGEGRRDWKLDEAQYLLRLASLRLLVAQDVPAAIALLQATDLILREQPDSGVFAVREELARQLAALEALPQQDTSGLFLRLAVLREQAGRLLAPTPVYDADELDVEQEHAERLSKRTRWERVLVRLERYVRIDFQRGREIRPQLDRAELQRIRHSLQLQIEQAQWAAVHGDPAVWDTSLQQALGVLEQFFEADNPQVQALATQLQAFQGQLVHVDLPDLSLLQQSLDAYVQSRRPSATPRED